MPACFAGYGDKAADVPAKLREAVLGEAGAMGITGGWRQNRKAHGTCLGTGPVLLGKLFILHRHRELRLHG